MLRVVADVSTEFVTINSPVLGRLDLDPSQVIEFGEPLAGFPDCLRYALLPYTLAGREDPSMRWLQALDAPFHTFLVTDPWSAVPDYQPEIGDREPARLGAPSFAETALLGILTVASASRELTINLQAPLLVNAAGRAARQVVILNHESYGTRHRVCDLP